MLGEYAQWQSSYKLCERQLWSTSVARWLTALITYSRCLPVAQSVLDFFLFCFACCFLTTAAVARGLWMWISGCATPSRTHAPSTPHASSIFQSHIYQQFVGLYVHACCCHNWEAKLCGIQRTSMEMGLVSVCVTHPPNHAFKLSVLACIAFSLFFVSLLLLLRKTNRERHH